MPASPPDAPAAAQSGVATAHCRVRAGTEGADNHPPGGRLHAGPRLDRGRVARATAAVVMVEAVDSRGTGFFVAPDVLVTNDHVVGRSTSVTVRLHDGTVRPARVERTVPDVDLAVLRVTGTAAPQVLTFRPSDDVRPGQDVIAIGSALGLQSTVTRGIVSARRLAGAVLLLQTDAAINPGNSGGPLLDRDGQVVGVTTLKMGSGAEGLGFALADDTSAGAQRTRGQQVYAQELGRLAQHAAQVDAQWTRFATTCQPATARDGDRDWFQLAERPTTFTGRVDRLRALRGARGPTSAATSVRKPAVADDSPRTRHGISLLLTLRAARTVGGSV